MTTLAERVRYAQGVIKTAAELSSLYYDKPVVVCYSGGKDSDVLLDIVRKTLKPSEFRVLNSHTTLDAPETVYYIRRKFEELRAEGIDATVSYSYYKGERTSFYKLILEKRMLPTRVRRYCCKILKETATPHQVALLGVREAESRNRQGRDDFGVLGRRKEDGVYKSAQHTRAMIAYDQDGTHDFECEIIKTAKAKKDVVSMPIYKFTESDVWDYIRENSLEVNPLYSKGYKRVGCIGCPMAGKGRYKEFAQYPKYRENLERTCDRLLKLKEDRGNPITKVNTGKEMIRWWLEEDPKQITLEEYLKGGTDT